MIFSSTNRVRTDIDRAILPPLPPSIIIIIRETNTRYILLFSPRQRLTRATCLLCIHNSSFAWALTNTHATDNIFFLFFSFSPSPCNSIVSPTSSSSEIDEAWTFHSSSPSFSTVAQRECPHEIDVVSFLVGTRRNQTIVQCTPMYFSPRSKMQSLQSKLSVSAMTANFGIFQGECYALISD